MNARQWLTERWAQKHQQLGPEVRFGVDELRRAVKVFNGCSESWCQLWTAEELIAIYRAHTRSEWDIPPDTWTPEQMRAAIEHGEPPRWDATGEALRPKSKSK